MARACARAKRQEGGLSGKFGRGGDWKTDGEQHGLQRHGIGRQKRHHARVVSYAHQPASNQYPIVGRVECTLELTWSRSQVAQNRAEPNDAGRTGQVLSFRRRSHLEPAPNDPAASTHADSDSGDDLAQYERDNDDIDYGHRMLMNVIALAIVAALIGFGVWIADTMAALEKYQDCVLQDRGNCAPIETAAPRHE